MLLFILLAMFSIVNDDFIFTFHILVYTRVLYILFFCDMFANAEKIFYNETYYYYCE